MLTGYYATAYRRGISGVSFDITFDSTDFQNVLANAYIDGPFSLIVDVDASTMAYPMYIGIELQGVGNTISVGDRAHIAFIPNDGRHVVGPASIPQLAYIDGLYNKVIIKCYGFSSADAAKCAVSLRIGPPAIISAPQAVIGRDTRAFIPGLYYTIDSGNLIIPAGVANVSLFSVFVSPVTGIRFRIKGVSITLNPTPSFPGDLEAWVEMVTDFATIEIMARVYSTMDTFAYYSLKPELVLMASYTLRCFVTNNNTGNNYIARAQLTYEEIY